MGGPKTTDQRQARTIADAIIERLCKLGGDELATEGQAIIDAPAVDYGALLDWNRRACDWILKNQGRKS